MVIPILIYCQEIAIHVFAILIVSLLSKWLFNNPRLFNCSGCQELEAELMEEDTDRNNYGQVRYRSFTQ